MDHKRAALSALAGDTNMPMSVRVAAGDELSLMGWSAPTPNVAGPLDRLKAAVDELNAAWANVDKPYSLWIDWNHRPRRVVITQGISIERDVLYP